MPCVGASGHDMASTAEGNHTADTLRPGNGRLRDQRDARRAGPQTLLNWTDQYVGTTSIPHPDEAWLVSVDPDRLIAWYTETGAALNDTGGFERDREGTRWAAADAAITSRSAGSRCRGPSGLPRSPILRRAASTSTRGSAGWPSTRTSRSPTAHPTIARGPIRSARFTFSVGRQYPVRGRERERGRHHSIRLGPCLDDRIIDAATRTPTASFPLRSGEPRPRSGIRADGDRAGTASKSILMSWMSRRRFALARAPFPRRGGIPPIP